jgi:hypothetical protein
MERRREITEIEMELFVREVDVRKEVNGCEAQNGKKKRKKLQVEMLKKVH